MRDFSMKNFIQLVITLIMGLVVIVYIAFYTKGKCEPKTVPSMYEIQEMLNKYEPENPIKVDGIIGPETIKKWERVYVNQSAMRTFEGN